jgi:hypothetical protein
MALKILLKQLEAKYGTLDKIPEIELKQPIGIPLDEVISRGQLLLKFFDACTEERNLLDGNRAWTYDEDGRAVETGQVQQGIRDVIRERILNPLKDKGLINKER